MTAQVFQTQQRAPGPKLPSGDLALEPPPALQPPQRMGLLRMLMFLPMLLMPAGMILMYAGQGSIGASSIGASFMGISMVGMMLPQMMRGGMDAQQNADDDRADYLRYLAGERKRLREASEQQRAALAWNNPDPKALVFRTRTKRLWERQPADEDFGEVRAGLGDQPCALAVTPPEVIPLEELEPVSALALRRLLETYSTVRDLPVAISLPGFARVQLDGDPDLCRGFARAVLCQLVTAHSPEFVRIALVTDIDRQADWDWVKWLPHGQHPTESDGAGSRRLFAQTITDLERDVLADMVVQRARFEPHPTVSAEDPFLVIVVDGASIPPSSRLATSSYRGVVVFDIGGALPWRQDRHALRLRVQEDDLAMAATSKDGEELEEVLGRPDTLALPLATALARRLARWRAAGDGPSAEGTSRVRTVELTDLLGIPDVRAFEPAEYWRSNGASGKLRVPIGVDDSGSAVELDIRESAQGGMGPHGMLVGATGSGKSELLRTLVLAMAIKHSSEFLNFVLADFKGGATFVGLDRLPHTSALITNLAEELALVDRMQDAIHGELVRRQELLRATGYASLLEYERARAGGAQLAPLPTLFLVIDEFSELLSARRDFLNLFVMVGRLGRSLGVHLLLATQRLEEGRVHQLEGHLSYRIGLRMFSASESRSVLGITDAYESPLTPGQGFLKTSTSAIVKFRGAYVSGQLKDVAPDRARSAGPAAHRQDLSSFSLTYLPSVHPPEPEEDPEEEDDEESAEEEAGTPADSRENTVLHRILEKLSGSGPPAHRVWLPPLSEPPTLDGLFGGLKSDPQRGLVAANWEADPLTVPVGIIDRPFEQRWDLLTVSLEGAAGHVGVVGAPQTGKSTLIRTLITALALTNTPAQVRFYCLDFSGGGLAGLAGLPHVGSVAARRDTDLVNRTLVELTELLDRRERAFTGMRIDTMADARRLRAQGRTLEDDDLADVFLVVDGWFTVKQDFEHLDGQFQQIAQRGLNFGVHLLVASNRWSDFRIWLRDVLGTKLELHLGDPGDSAIGMRVAANVPNAPGRGLTEDSMHFLAGLPRIDGVSDRETLAQGTAQTVSAIASGWKGESARSVRTLPALVRIDELPEPEGGPTSKDDLRVPIGIDEHTGEPYWWDFGQHPHLVGFGDTETGKTTMLRLMLRAITQRYDARQAKVVLADFRRELYDTVPKESLLGYATNEKSLVDVLADGVPALTDRIPSDDLPVEALRRRDWWDGPRVFVVVDDLDLLSSDSFASASPLAALPPFIAHGAHIGLHLIVTRATAQGSRGINDPAVRKVWDTGTPVLLFSCPREEGIIFGSTRPATLPPGRAQLITRRGSHLIQVGYVPDGPRADRS